MKRGFLIILGLVAVSCLCACSQREPTATESVSILEVEATEPSVTDENSWRDRYEVRDTNAVVAELKLHFEEHQEELERIAKAFRQEEEALSRRLYASWGKLYAMDSVSGDVDFSNPIESETGDLIANYYAKGFFESQQIYSDFHQSLTRGEALVFSYDAFLESDGVLTDVQLLYSEGEMPDGYYYYRYIPLNDHWQICVVDYPY